MARPKNTVPSYKLHKPSGQARVRIDGRDVYLGQYNSPESRREYARIVSELTASPAASLIPRMVAPAASLNEVLVAFLRHAEEHYRRPDGSATNELKEYKLAMRPLRRLYGHTPAAEFGPLALQTVRAEMVRAMWCRTRVNKQVGRLKRVFKWAAGQELIPVAVVQGLACIQGLQRGRTDARETNPVSPVPVETVNATLPDLWPTVRAMVELQRHTGMRPGEVRSMRVGDVDRSGEDWVYRPTGHKMAHTGRGRVIPLGPRARAVLVEFLTGNNPPPLGWEEVDLVDPTARMFMANAYEEAGRIDDANLLRDVGRLVVQVGGCVVDGGAYLFYPARAREERFALWRKARKSKVPPSQQNRRKRPEELKKKSRCKFTDHGYAAVVRRACERAGVEPWHPNQLRHTFASEVRRRYGLEAAQVILGHATADVTQMYAERDHALALRVAAEVG